MLLTSALIMAYEWDIKQLILNYNEVLDSYRSPKDNQNVY